MPPKIDPRLRLELDQASDDSEVQAFVLVASGAGDPQRGPAGLLVDRVSKLAGSAPSAVRFFPGLGAVQVTASAKFIRSLLSDSAVVAASSSATGVATPRLRVAVSLTRGGARERAPPP